MAFDSAISGFGAETVTHDHLDICACPMCANGGEDQFGVDGLYNQHTASLAQGTLDDILAASNKPIFTWEEAGEQISRWNAKWDDDGTVEGNALGTPGQVTYGFLAESDVSADTSNRDYRAMTAIEIAFTLMAIDEFEEVANLTFVRVMGAEGSDYLDDRADAQMDFQAIENYNGGWASPSWSNGTLNSSTVSNGITGLSNYGSWSYKTTMHEIGHAVGLPHPGDYNGSGATNYTDQAVYAQDTYMYSVMSYWSHSFTGGDTFETVYDDQGNSAWIGGYATGLLLHDIAALHRLYGANMDTRTGDTVYGFNSTEDADSHWNLADWKDFFVASIWDAGGVDTIDASGYYEDQMISLVEESFSSLGGLTYNLSIARGAVIENAIGGAGDDMLIGNAADNILDGGAGLDIVDYSDLVGGITLDLSAGTFTAVGVGTDTLISIEGVVATDGDDTLTGTADDNIFIVGRGNDTVTGGDGIDWISFQGRETGLSVRADFLSSGSVDLGGFGIKTFTGIEGVIGTQFDDVFRGDANKQYYDGGAGDDVFVVSGGADVLLGGSGTDLLDLRGSNTRVSINLYNDIVNDGGDFGAFQIESFENIFTTDGDDFVNGTSGANTIRTFDGDDTIYAQQGDDLVVSGRGNDYIGGWYGNDRLFAGGGDDRVEGQFGDDYLKGENGNDELYGGEGNDTIFGGAGNDLIEGGTGNDRLRGQSGNNLVDAGDGDDVIYGWGDAVDTIDGGAGRDALTYRFALGTGVVIDLDDSDNNAGEALGDIITGIEVLEGSRYDDILYGFANADDALNGLAGHDTIYGRGGNDFLRGFGGNDVIEGGAGNDRIYTHDGDDTLDGGDGNDTLVAGSGNDTVNGGADDDLLYGRTGIDILDGGSGNDTILGGEDDDILTGGAGADRFYIETDAGNDTVTDFEDGIDTVYFRRVTDVDEFSDLTLTQNGADVEVSWGTGDVLTLENMMVADLTADDFAFA